MLKEYCEVVEFWDGDALVSLLSILVKGAENSIDAESLMIKLESLDFQCEYVILVVHFDEFYVIFESIFAK